MDGVVLAGFDLDGDGGEAVVIVDQIIHLALAAVIVIEQLVAVRGQLLGHHAFIHRAEIDPRLIVQDRTYIAAVQNVRQKAYVVQIELEQVFPCGLDQRENRIGDGLNGQGDPGADQILKLVAVIAEGLSLLILDALGHHALFLVLHIGGFRSSPYLEASAA